MKAFYLPACALLLLGCNEPGDPNTISFTKVKRAPGDVRHDTKRMTMDLKYTYAVGENPPLEMEMRQTGNESSELTVLETSSGSLSKVQLKVIEKESTQKIEQVGSKAPAREEKEASPLTGKTLLLSRQGEEIIVTDEAGNPVDEVTRKAALEEADNIFDESGSKAFFKLIPDRPVKLGETFTLEGQDAIEIWGKNDGTIKEASVSFTLKERVLVEGRECAKFDATLLITVEPQEGMLMDVNLKGFLLLDTATSWPSQMKLNGPLTLGGSQESPQGAVVSKGTGTMTMEMEATFSKK